MSRPLSPIRGGTEFCPRPSNNSGERGAAVVDGCHRDVQIGHQPVNTIPLAGQILSPSTKSVAAESQPNRCGPRRYRDEAAGRLVGLVRRSSAENNGWKPFISMIRLISPSSYRDAFPVRAGSVREDSRLRLAGAEHVAVTDCGVHLLGSRYFLAMVTFTSARAVPSFWGRRSPRRRGPMRLQPLAEGLPSEALGVVESDPVAGGSPCTGTRNVLSDHRGDDADHDVGEGLEGDRTGGVQYRPHLNLHTTLPQVTHPSLVAKAGCTGGRRPLAR